MGTQLTVVTPLPSPAPNAPLPDLPGWVAAMVNSLGKDSKLNENGTRYVDYSTIPSLPTAEQRRELERHRGQLAQLLEQTPRAKQQFAKQTFSLIAKIILAKPSRAASPEATEARVEAYQIALDDVPSWAVEMAIRKWYRGECGPWGSRGDYDYRWAPESADLRQIAIGEAYRLRHRIAEIDDVLSAVPELISREQRERNKAALREAGLGYAVDD